MLRILCEVAAAALLLTPSVQAQGVLTVTPGRAINTTAGTTATVGYSGDTGAATAATLALPSAVAYDAAGNLYIADTNNHAVRLVNATTHVITTVAGTGTAGFSGDGGPATAAQLDTPTGVAVDSSGNLYIADSHNQRIREVAAGTITTIAGTGVAGFSGDSSPATAAQLSLPSGVAVDASGNVYIADTNNQRVRRIASGTITTVAGTGEQGYAGDGGAATAALLDSPTGVAVDSAGDLFIADRHNQRIREVLASGNISTFAGSGTPSFGGGYGGDGASATAASLANPTGVSIDASGNVYIADTNNQRVRQVAGGAIATVAGDGTQDPSTLNSPRGVANDSSGNLALADTLNQRVQASTLATIAFAATPVGTASATQTVTLGNSGSAALSVSSIAFTGPFAAASGRTCGAAPITLQHGASCTQFLVFSPSASGTDSGTVRFGGTGVVTQSVLLTGVATAGTTSVTLTSSANPSFVNTPITFTGAIAAAGSGATPTGTVSFYLNGSTTPFDTETLSAGSTTVAAQPYTFATAATYSVTATYNGDANYGSSTGTLSQTVLNLAAIITPSPTTPTTQSVPPGGSATFTFTLSGLNLPQGVPINLSAIGLPSGWTATFTPPTIVLGAQPVSFSVTITVPRQTGALQRIEGMNGVLLALGLLGVPISRRQRRNGRALSPLLLGLAVLGSLAGIAALSGCGTSPGYFSQQPTTANITIVATPAGTTSSQNVVTVQLTEQ